MLIIFDRVDDFDRAEEPIASMFDGLYADGGGELRLPIRGPQPNTAFWPSYRNAQRWIWRASASLSSLLAKRNAPSNLGKILGNADSLKRQMKITS